MLMKKIGGNSELDARSSTLEIRDRRRRSRRRRGRKKKIISSMENQQWWGMPYRSVNWTIIRLFSICTYNVLFFFFPLPVKTMNLILNIQQLKMNSQLSSDWTREPLRLVRR
jgi:hypothetical protein